MVDKCSLSWHYKRHLRTVSQAKRRQRTVRTQDDVRRHLFPTSDPDFKFGQDRTSGCAHHVQEEERESEPDDKLKPNKPGHDGQKYKPKVRRHDIVVGSWNTDGKTNKSQDVS